MDHILLSPPIAFAIMLVAAAGLSFVMSRISIRKTHSAEGLKPYASGEDLPTHMIRPDYGQFLPFAVFFTILHVVALVVATAPVESGASLGLAAIYLLGAVVGLVILYRR